MANKKTKGVQGSKRGESGASRAVLGTPPVRRAENKKRRKQDKHKASLGKLLADADRG